jgi:hypothetical protein
MKTVIRVGTATGVAGVLVAALAWGAIRERATPQPGPVQTLFGQVGVVAGQTFQLNVVYPQPQPEPVVPQPLPGKPVMVGLFVFDETGAVVAHSNEEILPGHSAYLRFRLPPETTPTGPGRANLHALVAFQQPEPVGSQPEPVAQLISTVEVFDSLTGRTSFVLTPQPGQRQFLPAL